MSDQKVIRLATAAREFNVGTSTLTDHLKKKGFEVENKPTAKLTEEMYTQLLKDFSSDKDIKAKADQISLGKKREDVELTDREKPSQAGKKEEEVFIKNLGSTETEEQEDIKERRKESLEGPKVVGKIDLEDKKSKKATEKEEEKKAEEEAKKQAEEEKDKKEKATAEEEKEKKEKEKEEKKASKAIEEKEDFKPTQKEKLEGPKVVGKIDLPEKKKPVASSDEKKERRKKRKRKRIRKPRMGASDTAAGELKQRDKKGRKGKTKKEEQEEISEKEIQDKIKSTMARLSGTTSKGKGKRRAKKEEAKKQAEEASLSDDNNVIQATEFISVNELSNLLNVPYTEIIQTCMNLGIIVSINQRLDAEVIELVADEYDYEVEFIDVKEQEDIIDEEEDKPEDLQHRAPIVTIMGHVDHGKTSLLDHIREENVVAGEQGGITQHIGAYEVSLKNGKKITFLDTPGHEAFTAMRARGAKVTDIAVIVIAADDNVMPQTKEAISHAQAANVPLVFAINKTDKENAQPEKIKEELAGMNLLVEDWGGKYQSQDISAKKGINVDNLLEKILLEAELLELKANPNKKGSGSVIEASLDKGRGYVATLLVQEGVIKQGDPVVAGAYSGKIKAMFNERGNRVEKAGPSDPVLVLGLDGAPQAGDKFNVMKTEQEAKDVAGKRQQILREQGIRTQKHITLDEIGRRLALGSFQELNIIVKGDFDGSVEALSDSLLKLSTEEIQVNIVHKGVGQITESDVLLASASDAIIVGFQVRPSATARQLAEKENIEMRLYSIIYDAIDEVKSAMEGMLEPKVEEKIVCNIEVRDIFKITKVGTIAGCYVQTGKITRNTKVRVIRDGIVVYTGELASLKRLKDDVREVKAGLECGLNIQNFNDVKVGDIIEGYEEVEVKRTL